jgi:hypothetical protein
VRTSVPSMRARVARILVIALVAAAVPLTTSEAASVGTEAPPLSTADAPWPRPDRLLDRVRAAGLEAARTELLDYHVHAHLDVFVDGRRTKVPGGIGISTEIPERETEDGLRFYSLSGIGCDRPCISPLHTHTDSGILHTESPVDRLNTLGEFFTEWGVRFTRKCVGGYCKPGTKLAIYVDGERFTGDPRSIELENMREIAVVIGKPPKRIPRTADFSQE